MQVREYTSRVKVTVAGFPQVLISHCAVLELHVVIDSIPIGILTVASVSVKDSADKKTRNIAKRYIGDMNEVANGTMSLADLCRIWAGSTNRFFE